MLIWIDCKGSIAYVNQLSPLTRCKSYPGLSSASSVDFEPLCKLPRASLVLAWLDISSNSTLFPLSNLCEIPAFPSAAQNDSTVFAVRNLANGDIFVLENVENDVYVAIKLADWVTADQVMDASFGKAQLPVLQRLLAAQAMADRLREGDQHGKYTTIAAVIQPPAPKQPKMKRGALARMAILPRAETIDAAPPTPDASSSDAVMAPEESSTADEPRTLETADVTKENDHPSERDLESMILTLDQSPQEMEDTQCLLDNLQSRYLETLYVSKTSVGYFAKGPLARTRAAFSSSADISRDSSQLAQFYRDGVLPLKKMDLKYKEGLFPCIQDLSGEIGLRRRKRKRVKRKIGKDGLYPEEPEFVQQWWQNNIPEAATMSPTVELDRLKSLSTELRSRETQLQILIILEAMILEIPKASAIKKEITEGELADIPVKKRQDLKTHLDLLADRLCIWYTISSDDTPKENVPGKKPNDKLRDFCAEVIIPFYASKLPEQCKALCKKLGGPTDISPKRPRVPLAKSASASKVLPGAEIRRRAPSTLHRTLTEDLSRSRSPSLPLLKRESSERPVSRGGMQARLLENRQVDLVAAAKQQESKLKRASLLADQKKELDAAISMLRKPHRGVVAKDIVDEAERRREAARALKKGIKPVQVMATPRKRRPGDSQSQLHEHEVEAITEILAVPASTIRPPPPSVPHAGVEETPSRGSARTCNPLDLPSNSLRLPSTTILATTPTKCPSLQTSPPMLIEATPAAPKTTNINLNSVANTPFTNKLKMTKSQKPVAFTPVKKTANIVMEAFASAPEVQKATTNDDDIYARLGWMEDGFDL